jgi:hypothetical protein
MQRKTLLATVAVLLVSPAAVSALTTTAWTEYASNPVYAPGKAYYPTIIKEGGTYTMWSDTNLQMATSADGITWTDVGTSSGLTNVRHAVVRKVDTGYRVWYWNSGSLYSINDMRTATSSDGLNWTNDQAISQIGSTVVTGTSSWNRGSYGPGEVFYNPGGSASLVSPVDEASVWANKYVMYYDGTTGGTEALGLAVSADGITWEGYNAGLLPVLAGSGGAGDWDRTYVSRCTVIKENDDAYHMWYSGGDGRMDHGIGYAFSTDGISWSRDGANPIFYRDDGAAWRDDRTYCPVVIGDEMWFTGKSSAGVYAIGYAVGAGSGPPIPEPVTMAGLVLGIGSLGGYLRRRRLA